MKLTLSLLAALLIVISYFYIDIPVARALHEWKEAPQAVLKCISQLTLPMNFWLILPVCYFLALISKRERLAHVFLCLLVAIACANLATELLKSAIGRERPHELFRYGVYGFSPFHSLWDDASFPSGHATLYAALWTALATLFPKTKWPLLPLFLLLTCTRLFGWHYVSDVVAGFALGSFVAHSVLLAKKRLP